MMPFFLHVYLEKRLTFTVKNENKFHREQFLRGHSIQFITVYEYKLFSVTPLL